VPTSVFCAAALAAAMRAAPVSPDRHNAADSSASAPASLVVAAGGAGCGAALA